MIKVKVNSQYKGMIAIRDKYLREAQEKQEDILIVHGYEQMLIPWVTAHNYQAISEKPVPDKFSKEKHFLLYYTWKPTIRQEILI